MLRHERIANLCDRLTWGFAALAICDRALKFAALEHFFHRPAPQVPAHWPTVSLIQPLTRGARGLHVALPLAQGEILCFMDDDILPRPDALRQLIPHAMQPGVGVAFGLPCHGRWETLWSRLLSGLINLNTVQTFVAQTYLAPPVRLIGHIAAYPRHALATIDELHGLEAYPDDDFEIARRMRAKGLRVVQTPVVYDVNNSFATWHELDMQLTRWYVLPRQAMTHRMTPRQNAAMLAATIGVLFPSATALLSLFARRRTASAALALVLTSAAISYGWSSRHWLQRKMPRRAWQILPLVVFGMPLHTLKALFSRGDIIEWRGQRMRIANDGKAEVLR